MKENLLIFCAFTNIYLIKISWNQTLPFHSFPFMQMIQCFRFPWSFVWPKEIKIWPAFFLPCKSHKDSFYPLPYFISPFAKLGKKDNTLIVSFHNRDPCFPVVLWSGKGRGNRVQDIRYRSLYMLPLQCLLGIGSMTNLRPPAL
jgi:hypothetical protein